MLRNIINKIAGGTDKSIQEENKHLLESLKSMSDEKQELVEKWKSLSSENRELRGKLDSMSKESQEVRGKLESLSNENRELRGELKFLSSEKQLLTVQRAIDQSNVEINKALNDKSHDRIMELYEAEKAKKEAYHKKNLELASANSRLKKKIESYAELEEWKKTEKANLQARRRAESLQQRLKIVKQDLETSQKEALKLRLENRNQQRVYEKLEKRLFHYHQFYQQENNIVNEKLDLVNALEEAFRATFKFTESSVKNMLEAFRAERDKIEAKHKACDTKLKKIADALKELKKEEMMFEERKEKVEQIYPKFLYLLDNQKTVLKDIARLEQMEKKLQLRSLDKMKEDYDKLIDQEFEYEQRKSRLTEKETLLKRKEKWMNSELNQLNKEQEKLVNENIEIQSKLYAEIEKNEQVLFIIRSLHSMNPLYEKIMNDLVASVRGEKTRRIVSSFLMGDSIYEIAQKEKKSATSVQRIVFLAINKLRKLEK